MFGFVRRSEFDAFRREVAREIVALRRTIDALRTQTPQPERATAATDAAPAGTSIELPGSGQGFPIAIVGESYRQATLKALAGDRRMAGEEVIFTAALVPEPLNAYDANAIKVHVHGGGHVGYLAKGDAAAYAEVSKHLISVNAIGLCRARLIGGTPGKPSLGVQLDLAEPDVVRLALAGASDVQPF